MFKSLYDLDAPGGYSVELNCQLRDFPDVKLEAQTVNYSIKKCAFNDVTTDN